MAKYYGKIEYDDGSYYEGFFLEDDDGNRTPDGSGTYYSEDETLEGIFEDGKFIEGVEEDHINRTKYQHDRFFRTEIMEDDEEDEDDNKESEPEEEEEFGYTGERSFFLGLKSGYGVYKYSDWSRYEGRWSWDCREGEGILYNSDGSKNYEGEWFIDEKYGKGTEYYNNGKYVGEFRHNKREGKGVYYWNDGDRYDGEWSNGVRNGKGVYYWNNGDRYDGEWSNNEMNGKGVYYYSNGDRYEGKWEKDKSVEGKYYEKDERSR